MYSSNLKKPELISLNDIAKLSENNISKPEVQVKKYNMIILSIGIIFFGIILIFRYNAKKKKDYKDLIDKENEKNV